MNLKVISSEIKQALCCMVSRLGHSASLDKTLRNLRNLRNLKLPTSPKGGKSCSVMPNDKLPKGGKSCSMTIAV